MAELCSKINTHTLSLACWSVLKSLSRLTKVFDYLMVFMAQDLMCNEWKVNKAKNMEGKQLSKQNLR